MKKIIFVVLAVLLALGIGYSIGHTTSTQLGGTTAGSMTLSTGNLTLTSGNLSVGGKTSTTGTSTLVTTNSAALLVGTSSASDVNVKAEFSDTATSTISIDSGFGGCIKMKNTAKTWVYCTVAATTFACSATSCE